MKPKISFRELLAARNYTDKRMQELETEVFKYFILALFFYPVNKRYKKHYELLCYEREDLENKIIELDNTFYKNVANIEFQTDIYSKDL